MGMPMMMEMMQNSASGESNKEQMMMMMMQMMMMMKDDNGGGGGGCMGKGFGGGSSSAVGEQAVCSVHNKLRTIKNLVEDGAGGYCCVPGGECNGERPAAPRRDGDWDCPGCGDHQFARNTNCRKCGHAKPMAAAGFSPY